MIVDKREIKLDSIRKKLMPISKENDNLKSQKELLGPSPPRKYS